MKCIHESKYKLLGFSDLGYYVFANTQKTQSDEIVMVESAKFILNNGEFIYLTSSKLDHGSVPTDLLNALRLKASELNSNPLNEARTNSDRLAI